ncbi:ABC transporter substrate-binding protein [Pueribacillus theae]|uniref:ABC transporter substrate-binding protein n=1 Tax=Pueribacillus theae TaxID=2171751 RepID=A0A2U1K1K5_9BACI|nr:EcsC family protein [Pueribacillus theae]PWA11135.1 ABC transporter substrate-binding protein [Pueribacillus theae]
MSLTKKERAIYEDILRWEEDFFQNPERQQQPSKPLFRFDGESLELLDNLLFLFNLFMQSTKWHTSAADKLLDEARNFDESIQTIGDMQRLPVHTLMYISKRRIDKEQIRSLLQGGLSGTGNLLFLGLDLPSLLVLNLRAVQFIAMTYGYSVIHPVEMLLSLKVFYTATISKKDQYAMWKNLEEEAKMLNHPFFYEGSDKIIDNDWLQNQLKQIAKAFLIMMLRKKTRQGIPFLSIAIGAWLNYHFSHKVLEIADKFYAKRLLEERAAAGDEL